MIGIRFCPVSATRARGIVAGRAKVSEDVHGLGWAEENGLLGSTDARGQAIRSLSFRSESGL